MTTATWTTTAYMGTDVDYRNLITELNSKFTDCGMVKIAQTGEVNLTTISKPAGVTTFNAFQIWSLPPGVLQTAAPIYIRFDFGTANVGTALDIKMQVGTAQDGAGVLSGTALTAARTCVTASSASPVSGSTYVSFLCVTEGFFGLCWKNLASASNSFSKFFAICRTCDSSSNPTVKGAVVYWGSAGASQISSMGGWQNLRFANSPAAFVATTTAVAASYCLIPGSANGSTDENAYQQAFLHWMLTPGVGPVYGMCSVYSSELGRGTQFSVALVGSTPRTYIGLGPGCAPSDGAATANGGIAMLWE